MHHFFVEEWQIREPEIFIEGGDVNHIKNVLRMKIGEKVSISTQKKYDYICSIAGFEKEQVRLRIEDVVMEGAELPNKITLFQGLAKGEKMEWIIQKCVELGVSEIVPVSMKRCIVKLDEKKAAAKGKRWNSIAKSAAEQSGRSLIPAVLPVMTMKEALQVSSQCDRCFVPYENAEGIRRTRELFRGIQTGEHIGVFIGPEGGFAEEEIDQVKQLGYEVVTLGKRILRTETAGMAVLAILMYELEKSEATV